MTLRERQYAAKRRDTARLTTSQIDDQLNLLGCPEAIRDEIVERLAQARDIPQCAMMFAAAAHAAVGQKRKYTDMPYITHPIAVAAIVSEVSHTPEMLAAAYLHDVVEDTGVGLATIQTHFGSDVATLVYWLTDKSKPEDGNRAARKAIDRAHSAAAPPEAQTIKLADLIDNTATIDQYDPEFAKVYRKEKEALLAVMDKGDPTLMKRAWDQLREFDEQRLQDHLAIRSPSV